MGLNPLLMVTLMNPWGSFPAFRANALSFNLAAGGCVFGAHSTSGWLFPADIVLTDQEEVVVEVPPLRCSGDRPLLAEALQLP